MQNPTRHLPGAQLFRFVFLPMNPQEGCRASAIFGGSEERRAARSVIPAHRT